MRHEMNLSINDGTSKSQLIKAIKTFEEQLDCDVLECFVADDHYMILVYFNGVCVAKRYFDDVQDFIKWVYSNDVYIGDISRITVF